MAWILDIHIAATAWVHGHHIVSADPRFDQIAADLAVIAPGGPRLEVHEPPGD